VNSKPQSDRSYRSFSEQSRHYFNRSHARMPDKTLDAAAAWMGRDLRTQLQHGTASWCYELSDFDIAELAQAERAAPQEMAQIDRGNFPLPNLAPRLRQWRRQLTSGLGVQVVRGFPVDQPSAWVRRVFWGLGHHLGEPGGQNPQQELLGEVKDYGEQDPNVRLYRTPHNINLHCDAADVVGLLCLQTAASGGHSRIVSTVSLYNALVTEQPDLVPHLFEPFKLDGRGERPEGAAPFSELTPSCFDGEHLRTFYHSDYMRSVERHPDVTLSPAQRRILDFYDAKGLDENFYLDMWLEPGDIQLLSNHTVAHARTAYEDSATQRRHLLRLWLSLQGS
jgi:hypothetical protein